MLRRTHVAPFVREEDGALQLEWLEPPGPEAPVHAFLDRLCRLVRRMEGRPRAEVAEMLRRQERRVRDVRRLSGITKALLDACRFRPAPGAERAEELREAVFRARGRRWPPVAGDEDLPYHDAARELGIPAEEIAELLYADRPDRYLLVRAPTLDGPGLLRRYNLELARGMLLEAESLELTADGGWKRTFRALKLSRLMVDVRREGRRRYRVRVTGPAAPWIGRPQRYGVRLARALPALLAAPGARIEASVHFEGRVVPYHLAATDHAWLRPAGTRRRRTLDSRWEEDLAQVLREKIGTGRGGWTLVREDAPIVLPGGRVFLPDFTLRHRDGREALVELVGFWTPEYLEHKASSVRDAGLENLVLVVSRRLGEGTGALEEASEGPVVWFTERPTARPVLEAAERVARRP
jgi:uncharacterized protein